MREDGDTVYYVIFNYGDKEITTTIPSARIGLDSSKTYRAKELWNGKDVAINQAFTVPGKDVKLIRIN